MAHTVTLSTSALVQDTTGATPVTSAQESAQKQVVDLEEFVSTVVVIPPSTVVTATPVVVSFAPFNVRSVYVKSNRPVTMQVGTAGADVYEVRSLFATNYADGDGPNALEFGNTDAVNSATVTVIAGSDQP